MVENFFHLFLRDEFVRSSEVIVIVDGYLNVQIHKYLLDLSKEHRNIVVKFEKKMGYGKANNIGVSMATGEFIFFINCDVFADEGCFKTMLNFLIRGVADCIQPLLIYPQTNLVQCAGTFFGQYFKDHLFDGNYVDAPIVQRDGKRQALTSALYAMKKHTFLELNGFDEFYYNKLESFELSYKLSLRGLVCWYTAKARAWHSRGGGRDLYTFDFRQQEAYFWSRFGKSIRPDIADYLLAQIKPSMGNKTYYAIVLSQIRSWRKIFAMLPFNLNEYVEMPWVAPGALNLWHIFPSTVMRYPGPLVLAVENIRNLGPNKYWFQLRNNPEDIVVDAYANLVNISEYLRL
jgi:glycosyltransferase involved in cell wall biosynthesis